MLDQGGLWRRDVACDARMFVCVCVRANSVSKSLHLTVFSQFVVISAEHLLFGCQQRGNDLHCATKTTLLECDIRKDALLTYLQ